MIDDSDDLVIEAFKVFDKDQDGKITKDEFMDVMGRLGQSITQNEMEQIYKDADDDDNGFITFDEFNQIYL